MECFRMIDVEGTVNQAKVNVRRTYILSSDRYVSISDGVGDVVILGSCNASLRKLFVCRSRDVISECASDHWRSADEESAKR